MPAKIPPIANYEAIGLREKRYAPVWEAINKGWQPGKPGKGIMTDGQLYTWNTDGTFPNHSAAMQVIYNKFSVNAQDPDDFLFIEPDGSFRHENPRHDPDAEDNIVKQDPRLKPIGPDTTWQFGAKTADFWEDERKKDFPEDFHEDPDIGDLATTQPHIYTDDEIRNLIDQEVQLGQEGKGLEYEDESNAEWPVDIHGGPHHDEVAQVLGGGNIKTYYLITPEGIHRDANDFKQDDDWDFGDMSDAENSQLLPYELVPRQGSVDENHNHLDWEEGNEGKGILLADGSVHTWNNDDYDLHSDYLADHPELDAGGAHYFYIEPHGKCQTAWGTLGPEQEDQLREADPRLYVDLDQGGATGWEFGA